MTPTWPYRVGDYQTFMQDELKQHIQNEGIQIIGYRALAELPMIADVLRRRGCIKRT